LLLARLVAGGRAVGRGTMLHTGRPFMSRS